MENLISPLLTCLVLFFLLRGLFQPLVWAVKTLLRGGCGFLCLWIVNTVSGVTGLHIPINPVTSLTAGVLGLPGIGILALLEKIQEGL